MMLIFSRVAEDPQSLISLSRVDSWFRMMLTTESAATDELWRRAFLALPVDVLEAARDAGVDGRDQPRRAVELAFPGPCGGCGATRAKELRTRWGLLIRACHFCFRYNTIGDYEVGRHRGLLEHLRRERVEGWQRSFGYRYGRGEKVEYDRLLRSSVVAVLRSSGASEETIEAVKPRDRRTLLSIAVKAAGLKVGKASLTDAFKAAVKKRTKPDINLMKTIREEIKIKLKSRQVRVHICIAKHLIRAKDKALDRCHDLE
eukprot:tig00000215_g18665.t1